MSNDGECNDKMECSKIAPSAAVFWSLHRKVSKWEHRTSSHFDLEGSRYWLATSSMVCWTSSIRDCRTDRWCLPRWKDESPSSILSVYTTRDGFSVLGRYNWDSRANIVVSVHIGIDDVGSPWPLQNRYFYSSGQSDSGEGRIPDFCATSDFCSTHSWACWRKLSWLMFSKRSRRSTSSFV